MASSNMSDDLLCVNDLLVNDSRPVTVRVQKPVTVANTDLAVRSLITCKSA